MNKYYTFYCPADNAYKLLGNTSYVGIYADSYEEALNKCKACLPEPIIKIDTVPDCAKTGCIY